MTEKELDKLIEKINYLAKKKKTEGLNDEETILQQELRQVYIDSFKKNFKAQLENLDIEYVD
ncbi:MAG: DUF896 domain-containing protein [Filifactoraceae bacterium]